MLLTALRRITILPASGTVYSVTPRAFPTAPGIPAVSAGLVQQLWLASKVLMRGLGDPVLTDSTAGRHEDVACVGRPVVHHTPGPLCQTDKWTNMSIWYAVKL